ncbi:hypothetical protein DPMN_082735 [Dreissena polymorpha]|uniref:Uncharacterized protein n=1 Tax=Dreissena polymorpha TaxID=45954 RepID=A0A9D3Y7F9_DREPO|nr:hypothetical protein DPMN_082735 [Dreissena polymorpha]
MSRVLRKLGIMHVRKVSSQISLSPWCNGYGVRLATGMSRVRSPLWERSFYLPYRHQVLVLGPGNRLESISNK